MLGHDGQALRVLVGVELRTRVRSGEHDGGQLVGRYSERSDDDTASAADAKGGACEWPVAGTGPVVQLAAVCGLVFLPDVDSGVV